MVDRWSGSIEAGELGPVWAVATTTTLLHLNVSPAGVTAIRPDELEFPNTMTDIDYDTWMLRYRKVLIQL